MHSGRPNGASSVSAVLDSWPHATLDLLPVPVFLATLPDGVILRANQRAVTLCGGQSPVASRLSTVFRGAVMGDTPLQGGADTIASALRSGMRLEDVDAVLDAGGTPTAVTVSIEPIRDSAGRAVGALATCHRVERWMDGTAALKRSEERLTLALSAAKLGAWEFEPQRRVLTASAQCKANHGFLPHEDMQLDTHIIPAVNAEYRGEFQAVIARAIETRGAFEIEVPHTFRDGSHHWLLLAGRCVSETCVVGVSLDITERREAEESLREADRRKDEFLAIVAHELRGPLAAILTAVQLLQAKGPLEPELQKLRSTILRQTLQLRKLVDDLLDVGRIIAGKFHVERRQEELGAMVKQAIETCAPLLERRRHALTVSLPAAPVYLHVDAARIVQVLCNLLNNAAKYMKEGGCIELTAFEEGGTAVLRVRDEGVGIAPEMLDRVFQRFVQVGSSQYRADGGLGIGLSLVKAVVELHGGSVSAASGGIGKGSEFTVRLPVRRSS